mmetsp:Transcript_60913/g.132126  ORF Transcript_60913/g.132126 Transcript_60913/m.132126 type:complete len:108 (+) Transcript_60913:76-399(+)
MAVLRSRSVLSGLAVAIVATFVVAQLVSGPSAFVAQPPASVKGAAVTAEQAAPAVLGAAAGLLSVEPAQASLLYDEILPVSYGVAFATIWGIVLGFVLLRLQEAFPE